MFESRNSAGGTEKLPCSENFRIPSWSFDIEGHAKKCVERYRNEVCCENCHMYTLKLFWNAYTWQELDDLIFYGQWTNLQDRSQNGPKHVTNAWIDWFHTFIILVNTNNIVMWVILPNNADWDGFKTLTSREILKSRNPLQVEHCAFFEVIRLFQSVFFFFWRWERSYPQSKSNRLKKRNLTPRESQNGPPTPRQLWRVWGPSAPVPPLRSKRDMANARTELQASREPHLRSQACLTRGAQHLWLVPGLRWGHLTQELGGTPQTTSHRQPPA